MRVIVCGGRNYGEVSGDPSMTPEEREADRMRAAAESDHVWCTLSTMVPAISEMAHGGSTGADRHAGDWADEHRLPYRRFPYLRQYGRAGGPLRNAQMLREFKPDAVIAFPGGRGTADMIRQARAAEVRVIEVPRHIVNTEGGQ